MSSSAVIVYTSDHPQNFDSLNALASIQFPVLVGNAVASVKPSYLVLLDPDFLYYSVKLPEIKNYDQSLKQGQFQPELWRRDLVELFIAADQGAAYQEFNFSPSGAYWTAQFSDYRKLVSGSDSPVAAIQFEIRATTAGKNLTVALPRSGLLKSCSFSDKSKINCCAIIGENPRNYYSTAKLNPDKPDFHDLSSWEHIQLCSI